MTWSRSTSISASCSATSIPSVGTLITEVDEELLPPEKLGGGEQNTSSAPRSRRRAKAAKDDEKNDAEDEDVDESDLTPLEEEVPKRSTRKRKVRSRAAKPGHTH